MAVEISESSAKVILDSDGNAYPIVRLLYRPANTNGPYTYRTIERVKTIPNASIGTGSGCYSSGAGVVGGVSGYWLYLIYDYENDVIYVPRVVNTPLQNNIFAEFQKSFVYKSYSFYRERPQSVVSVDSLRLTLTQKIVAWLTFCFSVGLSVWLLWECYKTLDRLLWLAHRGYTQRRISSYIDRVARENGGDPLGEGSKSTWERDFGDEPLPKPPGY